MGLPPAGRLLALACLASARLRAERSLRLRGGGVIDVLKHRAAKTLELEARRDDVGTALCGGRAAAGAFLLVQPLKHFDLDAEPRGARAYQLFFALHFYLRLAGLFGGADLFDRPRTRRARVAKFAASCAVGLASLAAARRGVGARLPNGLALGVLVARTATSIFDYAAAEVHERYRVVAAMREIMAPRHRLPDLLPEHLVDHERRAVAEAADAARAAVARQILHAASEAQHAARRTRAQKLHVQLARVAIAVATTHAGLRVASMQRVHTFVPPSPEAVALYAPAAVGAFEVGPASRPETSNRCSPPRSQVAHAVDEALYLNGYLVDRLQLRAVTWGVARLELPVRLALGLLRGLGALISGVVRVASRVLLAGEKLVFGEELFLYKLFRDHPRLRRAWRLGAAAQAAVVDAGALYRRATKLAERQTRAFLRKTHKDLWPWVVGFAGYRVQTGSLRLVDAPRYLSRKASEPVLLVSKLAARGAAAALRALAGAAGAPLRLVLRPGVGGVA